MSAKPGEVSSSPVKSQNVQDAAPVGALLIEAVKAQDEQFENASVASHEPSIEKPMEEMKQNKPQAEFDYLEPEEEENKVQEPFYEYDSARMEGKIFELVLLRRQSTLQEILQCARAAQKETHEEKAKKLEEKFNNDDIQFDLKLVRTIEDVNKYYGDLSDECIVL